MKMSGVRILDCTLRDGGYINNWEFDDGHAASTITGLAKANIDIIECGFLDDQDGKDHDSTKFSDIKTVNNLLEKRRDQLGNNTIYAVMINAGQYDLDHLPECNNDRLGVSAIRYAFHRSGWRNIFPDLKKIIKKGYKLFVQPMSTNSYEKAELIQLIEELNALDIYALYIVDSQGAMFKDDFRELYYLFNDRIKKGVQLGFHSHNNLQLAYSIAIDFIEIAEGKDIIIDSSIYGMGRGAGNLNTELLADYINRKVEKKYEINHILDLIDKYFYSLHKKYSWGYSLAHFLSASLKSHPNYASFLLNKKNLPVVGIKEILSKIPEKYAYEYNKEVIEELYFQYNAEEQRLVKTPLFKKDGRFLLIASGRSVKESLNFINGIKTNYDYSIAINHVPQDIVADYYFFNSQKRYEEFRHSADKAKIIVSSNIVQDSQVFVLDYEKLINLGDKKNDNSTIMFINYLSSIGLQKVSLAGLDGYEINRNNYSYQEYDAIIDEKAIKDLNEYILAGLNALADKIEIDFSTRSIFEEKMKIEKSL